MTRTTTRRRFLAGTAATAAATTLPSTAAADHQEDDRGTVASIMAFQAAMQGRLDSRWQRTFGEVSDAESTALAARDAFNPNSGEWVAYLNDHAHFPGETETVALEFAPNPDGETYPVYLEVAYDGEDNLTSANIADETDRTVDETARLESIAAENAAEEIETAYEKFVATGEAPTEKHLAYLAGKYRFGTNHVTSTLLGDDLDTE